MAFANLGVRLGVERLIEEYRRWGFDAGDGALLGGAGRVHTRPRTPRQVADLAVGLEWADVTPLHAALLASIVANDGRLPEPRLLLGRCGGLGLSDEPVPPPPGRVVMEPAVTRRLRKAMEAVAESGTGAGIAPTGFPVAMKTGTAAQRGVGYHVNYIGLGPLPEPTIAFCVRVTHEPTSPAANRAARGVTRRLLELLAEAGAAHNLDRPGLGRKAVQAPSGPGRKRWMRTRPVPSTWFRISELPAGIPVGRAWHAKCTEHGRGAAAVQDTGGR